MKRILLVLSFIVGQFALGNLSAQSWKMIITKTDGTTEELLTSDISDISFTAQQEEQPVLPDKNADQIIIKEIYNGGCTADDGVTHFHMDKSIIIYNNCPQ